MAAGDESSKGSAYNCAPWDSNFEQNKPLYRSERVILSSKTTADAGSSQEMIRDPFASFRISDVSELDSVHDRTPCPQCSKSVKYFCYKCYIPVETTKHIIPKLKEGSLPCKVDILKCPKEVDGKSTAIHAKVIAPGDVRIFTYPDMPEYLTTSDDDNSNDKEVVLFLFPGPDAVPLREVLACRSQSSDSDNRRSSDGSSTPTVPHFRTKVRLLVIDSAWDGAKKIQRAVKERKNFKQVFIPDRDTLFWRYQTGLSKKHLATIEAIYYFLVDYHNLMLGPGSYRGEYDELLYLFKFMYGKIHKLYEKSTLRSYKWRKDKIEGTKIGKNSQIPCDT